MDADDRGVFFPGGRMSWELGGSDPPADPGVEAAEAPQPPRASPRTSLDLDISYGSASDEQSLGPGQVVVVGGAVFTGPDELQVDFDLTRALFDVRFGSTPSSGLSVEGFVGVEYSHLDLLVRNATVSGPEEVGAIGPALGAALVYEPSDPLRLFAEGRFSYGLSSEVDDVKILSFDLGLAWLPTDNVGLSGGWRTVGYEAGGGTPSESDLELGLSGPTLTLLLRF